MVFTTTPVVPLARGHSGTHATSPRLDGDALRKQPTERRQIRTRKGRRARDRHTLRLIATALGQWLTWVLVAALVLSQFTCIFSDSQSTTQYVLYGQDPARGPFAIDGFNDEPYSDRSLVCVQQGRLYRPKQLSALLASKTAQTRVVDSTGALINGYRIVPRHDVELLEATAQRYTTACDAISATLEPISRACQAAGYNVVHASSDLHVLDGVSSAETTAIVNSLPVVILPYWDNAVFARYAMPGVDGSACVFHLSGRFDSASASSAWLDLTSRREREASTMQWLGISPSGGAAWRNGWLEDPSTGMKWYADMASSVNAKKRHLAPARYFDLLTGREADCVQSPRLCHPAAITEWWGAEFSNTDQQLWVNAVAISNGSRFGLFLYEASQTSTLRSRYNLATLISNSTVIVLLLQWLAASVALFNAYRHGHSRSNAAAFAGVGCLSCARGFEWLPLLMLPRLTVSLAGFFTAGCRFEGEQRAFSEAWFVIYPALAEVMLFYYSVLNLVAKTLSRRVSDALFGPSLMVLCVLHWLRRALANAALYEFDGRIATVMTAREFEKLRLVDLFTTGTAFRLNGNVRSIFAFKLVLLAANLVPLVFSQKITKQPWGSGSALTKSSSQRSDCRRSDAATGIPITTIERALGVRASDSAGLGLSSMYLHETDEPHRLLNPYELVRLGYVVFGDSFVIPLRDWLVLMLLALVQMRRRQIGLRVMAFRVGAVATDAADTSRQLRGDVEADTLQLYQLQDAQLANASVWNISAMPLL